MKRILLFVPFLAFASFFVSCDDDDEKEGGNGGGNSDKPAVKQVEKTNKDTKVWAHFMVWYETPEHEGHSWGQHWRQGGQIPYFDEEEGTWKDIYTRFPPLTGPYYSSDPDILEYQLLLMKYAGIDGVIPDWYGVSDRGKAEDKTSNMEALWAMTKKVGLELAVCYEDRFKSSDRTKALSSVKDDLQYLRSSYFNSSSYSKIDGVPMLLIFGPVSQPGATFWEDAFADFSTKPAFFTLYAHATSFPSRGLSYGQYNWPNNCDYKQQYTSLVGGARKAYVAGAWPGFKDCYNGAEEEDAPKYAVTEHRNGQELQEQLDYALTQKPAYLQIATWNDYGEGTMIEPTYKFGYIFLEKIQKFTGVKYTKVELEAIKRLFDMRKEFKGDAEVQKKLDQAFAHFNALEPESAVAVMDEVKKQ